MMERKNGDANSVLSVLDFIEENDNFYIFGAGGNGIIIKKILEEKYNKKVLGFLDNSPDKEGEILEGLEVYNPRKLYLKDKKILIASLWFVEISHQLSKEFGLKFLGDYGVAFYWLLSDNPNMIKGMGSDFDEYLESHEDEFNEVVEILEDEYSKSIYGKILNYRKFFLNPEKLDLEYLPCPPQRLSGFLKVKNIYENRIPRSLPENLRKMIIHALRIGRYSYKHISPEEKNNIIDGGSYIGDSAGAFACLSPQGTIWAFEPFEDSFNILSTLSSYFGNVKPVKKALWRRETILQFEENPFDFESCRISSEGKVRVETVSVDTFSMEKGIIPDFVKLDVEGAEFQVLLGTQETIKEFKPDLAISVYHSPEDLWKIPLWLKESFPDCKIYVDHKDPSILETVCFVSWRN